MNWLRIPIRCGLSLIDRIYHARRGCERVGPLLMIGRERHVGGRRCFDDGTVIRNGDIIGSLHLDNLAMARLSPRSSIAAAIDFRNQFRTSLQALAQRSMHDPEFAALAAYRGITWIPPRAARYGFTHDPIPHGNRRAFNTLYFRLLLWAVAPDAESASSAKMAITAWWITRKQLQENFGGPDIPDIR